jgi:hypothetical protein
MHKTIAFALLFACCLSTNLQAQEKFAPGDMGSVAASGPLGTKFTIITTKGYVRFGAGRDWSVLSLRSKAPVATAVFQIKNKADDGTPDSTNLIISLLSPGTKPADKALEDFGKVYGEGKAQVSKNSDWTVYRQQAHQGPTLYTIIDAKKPVADVIVTVRLAWPKLAKGAASYDVSMQATFQQFLQSIVGNLSPYRPEKGEVMRRPE